jgi:hypothetical protein
MGAIGLQRGVQNLLIGAGAKTFGKVSLWTCERVVGQFDCGDPPRSRSSASVTLANSRHCKAASTKEDLASRSLTCEAMWSQYAAL